MECKCPNCKADAKASNAGGVEYVNCEVCGRFQQQADGTWTVGGPPQDNESGGEGCSEPPQPAPPDSHKKPSSVKTGDDAGGSPPPAEPVDQDEGGLEIEFVDKVDY
jgi:hypothetical protein